MMRLAVISRINTYLFSARDVASVFEHYRNLYSFSLYCCGSNDVALHDDGKPYSYWPNQHIGGRSSQFDCARLGSCLQA